MSKRVNYRVYGLYDADAVSRETGYANNEPSRTIQEHAADADINNIVRNFGVTGKVPTNVRIPMEGDFSDVGDYRSCLHALREAEESFMAMPAELRQSLGNDPGRFVEWCESATQEQLAQYGLAPAPLPPVDATPVTTPVLPRDGQ